VIDHYLFTGDPYALETLRQIAEYTLGLYAKQFKDNYELRLYDYTVRADYLCGELMIEYHRLTWDPKAWETAPGRLEERAETAHPETAGLSGELRPAFRMGVVRTSTPMRSCGRP